MAIGTSLLFLSAVIGVIVSSDLTSTSHDCFTCLFTVTASKEYPKPYPDLPESWVDGLVCRVIKELSGKQADSDLCEAIQEDIKSKGLKDKINVLTEKISEDTVKFCNTELSKAYCNK
ncbi:hypothetical protein Aduo_002916 [Ancylostoma duodenale]